MKENNRTNCKNCGAVLHYDLKNRIAKCEYCSTEYHLDNLGRIEEYKVELDIYGQRRTFYIDSISMDYDHYSFECWDLEFAGKSCFVRTGGRLKLELTSYE